MVALGPWNPSMPWPSGTAGGASSPSWGGYLRLWVRAAIDAGNRFTLGPHEFDRLDDGNTLAGAPAIELLSAGERATTTDELFVDLSCDVLDLDVQGGASSSEGVLTKPDVATLVVNLSDPQRKYDPLNQEGPYVLGGRSRIRPAVPVDVFAEVVDADTGAITREWLFTGTADSWGEDWTPHPRERVAVLTASGAAKRLVKSKQPETDPPVGAGDTTEQRVQRILDWAEWLGGVVPGAGVVTHAATALDADGWELLQSTLDDELGFVYVDAEGVVRWIGRHAWFTLGEPVLALGCGEGLHDVLLDASPSAIDTQIRNRIFAGRDGSDVVAVEVSEASISRYGRYDYDRTNLGVETDAQAAAWGLDLLQLYAMPQVALADVTFRPGIDPRSWELWPQVLAVAFVTDLVRVLWAPADRPADAPIDALVRVVGFHYAITRSAFEITWQTVDAEALAYSGMIFTLGPHAHDRLDAGFVLG
jgi:hypothetical protein